MQYMFRLAAVAAAVCFGISAQGQNPLFVESYSFTNKVIELKAFNNAGDLAAMIDDEESTSGKSIPVLIRDGSVIRIYPTGTPNLDGTFVTGMSQKREDGGVYLTGTAIMSDGFWRAALWNVAADGTFTYRTMPNIILPPDSLAPGEQARGAGAAVSKSGVVVGAGQSYLAGLAVIWNPPYSSATSYLLSTGSGFNSINEDGLLLANGVEFDHGNSKNRYAAAVLFAGGVPQEVPLLEPVSWLYPNTAKSMSGEWVAGSAQFQSGSRGFAWKIGTASAINLPDPAGMDGTDTQYSDAFSINSSGNAVGYLNGGSYSMSPILWRYANGSHTALFLNDLLPGEQYPYHTVEQSILINDDSEIAFTERAFNGNRLKIFKPLNDGIIQFVTESAFADEEAEALELTLKLFRAPGNNSMVTANYRTVADSAVAGRDFVEQETTISWAPGEAGEKRIRLPLVDNDRLDGSRSFKVALTGAYGAQLGERKEVVCYVSDAYQFFNVQNVMPSVTRYGCVVLQGQPRAIVKVERTGGTDGEITFTNFQASGFGAEEGVDFEMPAGLSLSWRAGEGGTKTFSIPLLNTNEMLFQSKTITVNATGNYTGSEETQYLSATVIVVPRVEDAQPVIDTSAIHKLLEGLSLSISAIQGSVVQLETSLGGLTSKDWSTTAEARSEDGMLTLSAPVSFTNKHGFFRIKVK